MSRYILLACIVAAAPATGFALAACGGDNATVNGNGNGDGGNGDGTIGGDDGSSGDTGTDTASDTGGNDGGGGGDGGACDEAGTRKQCNTCCDQQHPQGARVLENALIACACKPAVCGPNDGGTANDAGFGGGACAAQCKSADAGKSQACDICANRALGSQQNPGPCFSDVATACQQSPACVNYVACLDTCKGLP
jgi:hypothetical protein